MSSSSRLFLFLDIFIAEVINLNVMVVTKMIVHASSRCRSSFVASIASVLSCATSFQSCFQNA